MDKQYKDLAEYAAKVKEISESILKDVDEKMAEMKAREEKWKKLEEQMEENSNKLKNKITLDVGGKIFSTSKETLLMIKDSYFSAMLQSGHFKPDESGTYFIDRSPKYFALILEFMRTGKLSITHLNPEQLENLKIEFDYYQIHPKEFEMGNKLAMSKVIDGIQLNLIEKWANKKVGALLWRGSEHGFSSQLFHTSCDNQGSTVVIVKCNNNIFGGYSDASWHCNGAIASTGSFLFTLVNSCGIPPTKYPLNSHNNYSQYGVLYGNMQYGPTFGNASFGAYDLTIVLKSRKATATASIQFPKVFQDTTGYGQSTFTGSVQNNIDEIEVFKMN